MAAIHKVLFTTLQDVTTTNKTYQICLNNRGAPFISIRKSCKDDCIAITD